MNPLSPLMMAAVIPEFRASFYCLTPWVVVTGALLLLLYRNRRRR